MIHRRLTRLTVRAFLPMVFVIATLTSSANAQLPSARSGWGATVMMEPIIASFGGFSALCNPSAARRAGWGADQIAKVINLTSAQRALLDDLRTATAKAAEPQDAACPRQIPSNSRDRVIFLEQRLAALLNATKTIIPAFEAFHASLTDEQKVQLDRGPRRWSWRR